MQVGREFQMAAIAVLALAAAFSIVSSSVTDRNSSGETPMLVREPTAAELMLLEEAEERLIAKCMNRQGVPFWVVPQQEPVALQKLRDFSYVIDDVAWARRYGFGRELQRRLTTAKDKDPNQQYFRSLPPDRQAAARAALVGERPQGLSVTLPTGQVVTASDRSCIAQAQAELYGDLRTWFRVDVIASNLRPLYVPQVRRDPRYLTALAEWAACIRRLGMPYDSPEQLRAALPGRTAGLTQAEAQSEEVRMAVTEARCALRTRLAATAQQLDEHYGSLIRERYRSEVNEKRRLQLAALTRARQITGTGP